ncbi:MAG: prolyl oligopeptidase family serine peptidase [Planctomycetaceae bacterium]|jgi:predicted alpha/beta superfamily hydrolase|nr:prolyl oligopeptidase family serine peptidase [Planctomycetaceae bacterium]
MKKLEKIIVFLFICLSLVGETFAQPDLSKPLGKTIADTGSKFYRFEKFDMDSNDGKRHYKITVGIPKTVKGEESEKVYPVFYMLDGNAALAVLNDDLFSRLESLPVIVAIGYQTDLRFDVQSRAFDYTPSNLDGSEPNDERGRKGGGADIFATFIETKIKPKVESFARIDKQRQTLWGHSYGGLFVLNTLFKHNEMFQNYVAAEPSFWWQDGLILKIETKFTEQIAKKEIVKNKSSLAVLIGKSTAAERRNKERPVDSSVKDRSVNVRRSVSPSVAEDMIKRLSPLLKKTEFRAFDGISHGPMLPTSLEPALRFCIQ